MMILGLSFRSDWNRSSISSMTYRVVLQQSEEGFAVSCPGLPGCWSQGATEQEALENIKDAIREYLESLNELRVTEQQ
jgi:predicted RNase H-like HicB family nuclease